MSAPKTRDFALALDEMIREATRTGETELRIRAGDLHRQVGGRKHPSDRMPACCNAMRQCMVPGDRILAAPPKGDGANLLICYRLGNRSRPVGTAAAAIPQCPSELPADIASEVRELGRKWACSDRRPEIEAAVIRGWSTLIGHWTADASLPLLVRKGGMTRGAQVRHNTGRAIIITDNSPAQWSCNLALRGIVPTLDDIRQSLAEDALPLSFALKPGEREARRYHCTLRQHGINKAGWKLCHIRPVGLNARQPLAATDIAALQEAFSRLLSPANYFLLPKQWGGLGEARDFIDGFLGV